MDQKVAADKVLFHKYSDVQHILQQYEELRDNVVDEMNSLGGVVTSASDPPNKAVPVLKGYTNEVELQNRITQMATKFNNLRDVFDDVANQNIKLGKQLDMLTTNMQESEQIREAEKASLVSERDRLDSSRRRQDDSWHKTAQERTDEADAWKKKSNELETQHGIQTRRANQLQDQLNEMSSERDQLKKDKEQLGKEKDQLKKEAERLKSRSCFRVIWDSLCSCRR